MNSLVQQSTFEVKIAHLREEMNALTETVIAAHLRKRDEADLDEEIVNIISWNLGIQTEQQAP